MKPGRRPAAEVRAAILTAAGSLLFEEGISGVTFPDTGSVLADLRAQLHAFVDVLMDQARAGVIAGLIGAARTDPELARELHLRYTAPRRHLAAATLELGKNRGQIKQEVDSETLIDQLWGACYHRLLLPAQPLSHHFADRLISNLFSGIEGTEPPRLTLVPE